MSNDEVDRDQLFERLSLSPAERLQYLVDMLDFERRAHRAKRMRGRSTAGTEAGRFNGGGGVETGDDPAM